MKFLNPPFYYGYVEKIMPCWFYKSVLKNLGKKKLKTSWEEEKMFYVMFSIFFITQLFCNNFWRKKKSILLFSDF